LIAFTPTQVHDIIEDAQLFAPIGESLNVVNATEVEGARTILNYVKHHHATSDVMRISALLRKNGLLGHL
jgi:hypothetical protein